MKKTWKVFGAEGHRQRAAFDKSGTFTTWDGAICTLECEDKTGTYEYVILTIESEDPDDDLNGQISDGIFENCRVGRVEEIKKYVVEVTDYKTGVSSDVETIVERASYTAADYVRDCEKNADQEWIEMLHAGEVRLIEV